MQEFTTVSSSSYDPSALATKLNEKSAEGWSVVSIVSTGGDVTAFLSRESSGQAAAEPESVAPMASSVEEKMSTYEPMVPESPTASEPVHTSPVAEPSGWAVAPEPASPSPASSAPAAEPATTSYSPSPAATTYSPAPAAAPAATPSVPAGWYADPAGRFELRYWDGSTWTEHVSRAGQQYTDPPVA
ncbi:MAG: DUF2510 domain-containing protein [Ilumatobacteraceae bacterium]